MSEVDTYRKTSKNSHIKREQKQQQQQVIQTMIRKYQKASKQMSMKLRNVPEYPSNFGVHSAANAINAGIATTQEIKQYWMQNDPPQKGSNDTLNDSTTICSLSQFNQYWILQAYGNMVNTNTNNNSNNNDTTNDLYGMEYALKSIELCWGPMMKLSTGGCFWELSSPEWLRFMKEGVSVLHSDSDSYS